MIEAQLTSEELMKSQTYTQPVTTQSYSFILLYTTGARGVCQG